MRRSRRAAPQPFQKVEVPAAVYEGAARAGLADVRVFNADGELVPFAWVPRPAAVRERPPPSICRRFRCTSTASAATWPAWR